MESSVATRRPPRPAVALTRVRPSADVIAFAALLAVGAAIVLYETRGLSFYFDDWEFVLHRRGLSAHVLLSPHGPHLSLIPILIYKLLLKLFGGASYLPFRALAALDLVALGLVLGVVCRRRWGRWWGLAPVLLLMTLGPGAIDLLWSFQVGYAVAVAAGLISLFALSRGGRYGNPIACVALLTSLASASYGIGFLAGAAVLVVLRGNWRRSAWVVVVPAVLYGLWYLKYGRQQSETDLALWRTTLPYVLTSFSSTISGMLGLGSPSSDLPPQLDPSFGEPLALAAIAALAWALWRGWRPPPLFWAALTTMVVLWMAASLSNVDHTRRATDSRYLPPSMMLLAVCLCTALPRPRLRGAAAGVAVAALVVVAATNAGQFHGMRNQMAASDIASRAELGALLILRGNVPPQFSPAPPFLPGLINDVEAGPFYSAVDSFGTIADSPAQLLRADEGTRTLADQVLERGERIGLVFAPAAVSSTCVVARGGSVVLDARPGTFAVSAPRRGPVRVALGRFATGFDIPLGTVPAGRTAHVHVPVDRAPEVPWRMLVSGSGGRVCAYR